MQNLCRIILLLKSKDGKLEDIYRLPIPPRIFGKMKIYNFGICYCYYFYSRTYFSGYFTYFANKFSSFLL